MPPTYSAESGNSRAEFTIQYSSPAQRYWTIVDCNHSHDKKLGAQEMGREWRIATHTVVSQVNAGHQSSWHSKEKHAPYMGATPLRAHRVQGSGGVQRLGLGLRTRNMPLPVSRRPP